MAAFSPLTRVNANDRWWQPSPKSSQNDIRDGQSLSVRCLAVDECDLGALLQELRQPVDVPVGEAHAAVRLRLAHLRGVRRPVNAIAFRGKTDPIAAHRAVGPRLDGERLFGFDALELVVGVVA